MGKILFTNNNQWHDTLHQCFSKYGFRESGRYRDSFFITAYEKLNISNYNYLSVENDFIACAGTLIFRYKIGKEALKELFSELLLKDISEVRKELLGSFVVIYKSAEKIRVFVDEVGTYAFYYSIKDNNEYLLTNTYYHIQKCVKNSMNKYALMEQMLESCILNNETPFDNIFRILGNECIVIDLLNNKFKVESIKENKYLLDTKDFYDISTKLELILRGYSKRKKALNEKLHIFTTGGVDSRIALASSMSVCNETVICNWQGCPRDMNTKIEDYNIAKKIADRLGLECRCFDVSYDNLTDIKNISKDRFEQFGEYCRIYGNNKKWIEIFEKNSIKNTDFGYFGETLKGWEILDNWSKDYLSLDEYSRIYMNRRGFEVGSSDYYNYVTQKLKNIIRTNGFDETRLKKEECMKLYYTYRIHADTVIDNFANMFGYSFTILAQKEITDYINQIPYVYKTNYRLNLELTQRLCPELLEIEYFTHCRFVDFDKKRMVLKERWKYLLMRTIRYSLLNNKLGNKLIQKSRMINFAWINEYIKQIKETKILEYLNMDITEKTFGYLPTYVLILFYCKTMQFSLGSEENYDQ